MDDVALNPSLLEAEERRTYILEVCSSMLELVDEMIADNMGVERIKLVGIKEKVAYLQQTISACQTNADFDRVEAEMSLLCDVIADDMDEGNKPN